MASLTGYSLSQIHEIKGELVRAGYLNLINRSNSEGGQDTNAYDFSGLLEAVRKILQPVAAEMIQADDEDAEEARSATHKDGTLEDDGQGGLDENFEYLPRGTAPRRGRRFNPDGQTLTLPRSIGASNPSIKDRIPPSNAEGIDPSNIYRKGGSNAERIPPDNKDRIEGSNTEGTGGERRLKPGPVARGGQGLVTRAGHEIESLQEETKQEDDSNQRSQKINLVTGETKTSIPGYSPYIAAVASDFSSELGDAIHEVSNMKQALNLWRDSGLGEQQFVEVMHEARKLTRRYQSRPTWDAMKNKMSYFFATLRDLLTQGTTD